MGGSLAALDLRDLGPEQYAAWDALCENHVCPLPWPGRRATAMGA